MKNFGLKFAATMLITGTAAMPVPGYADVDGSDFVNDILNAPTISSSYTRRNDPRFDQPPPARRAPTNIATVRSRALPPAPLVALRQAKLKPAEDMGIYATAIFEQLGAPAKEVVRTRSKHRKKIIAFYQKRNFKPLWVGETGLAPKARHLLSLMKNADEEGLDARDYLPTSLNSFDDQADSIDTSPTALARLELELTAAALEYSHDASAGRVKPFRISKLHTLKAKPVAINEVLDNLKENQRPDLYLASLQPEIPQYKYLKKALAKFRGQSDAVEEIHIPAGALIRPGGSDSRIELIAKRLEQLGYYDFKPQAIVEEDPTRDEATSSSYLYNTALVSAVKDLQEQSGLRRDGIIGRNTLSALNGQSNVEKISKIILSMERLRWLPQDLKKKYVFINQAFFETWMMDDGKEIFRSDVIVGKPLHQTAVFMDEMEKVVLNPRWYVPRSIIYNEMMPKLYQNPYYLQDQGYEVMDRKGRLVDSASINWAQYGEKNIPYNVRQPSGPKNALGRVKFLFPNQHAIYMHDTPARSLFKKSVRSLSHGCVRVQKPMEFAEIILKTEGWTPQRIAAAVASGKNQTVYLSKKIPVYLGYYTAWADAEGNVRIKDDIYSRDRILTQALEQNDKVRAPRRYALND